MAYITQSHAAAHRAGAARPSLRSLLALWRSRRALARLDTRALDDIGLSVQDARLEAARPVWDVPHHWRA